MRPRPKRPTKRKARKKKRKLRWASLFFKMGVLTALLWALIGLGYYCWALTYDLDGIFEMPQRSTVYDCEGEYYSRLAGENRIVVPFDHVSNHFINALLAREDTRFYSHHGIDPVGIARAVVRNFIAGGFRQGASTITQQLARNSFPLGGKTLHRKLVEAALAFRIETELTKEQILESYMNRIYFGSGFYGVEAASRAYFGKPASRLDLSEAAILAGLIRSPNNFSPFNDPRRSLKERDVVLNRMEALRFITADQKEKAIASRPRIAPRPQSTFQKNWAMATILDELHLVLDQDQIDAGGLQIHTTIDGDLQRVAERAVSQRLDAIERTPGFPHRPKASYGDVSDQSGAPWLEAAAIALDSETGGIRAIVGGRDLKASRFNRAIHGERQVGSAIKPFVYAMAFERGVKPRQRVSDGPLTPQEIPTPYGSYNPSNSDRKYGGELPAEDGLIFSRNTMTVRMGFQAGLPAVNRLIRNLGLHTSPPEYPSLFLGAFEANLKNLTAAYTVFATGGIKLQPYLIEKITDSEGNLLYRATRASIRILEPGSAKTTASIMEKVIDRGTARSASAWRLPRHVAGKTGTTNEAVDAWFVGFDRTLVCGVWVGFDRPQPIRPGASGANMALPIWADILQAHQQFP